jgi:uncharacterized protein
MIYIKIHDSYRRVVAICDVELIGKKFEEDIRQIELGEHFFKGREFDEEQAIKFIQSQLMEDATFNIVGDNSIRIAIKAGAISQENISKIQNIPFALKLL